MQNDGKVGPGSRTTKELAMHSPLTRLPVILLQVHDKAAQQLRNELQVLFENADQTLFEMADKAQSDTDQSLFFEAMRDVRLKRKSIERGFLERLFDAFIRLTLPDVSEPALHVVPAGHAVFSLMADNIERAQVTNAMVTKVLSRNQLALCQLSTRLNTLSCMPLDEQNNPLGPAMLCEYFLQAERDQGMDIKVKLIMLRLFDKYLLSQTGQLYADANQLLIATGVLPDLSDRESCCAAKADIHAQELPGAGEDASNLIGLLFDYISDDRNLSQPLKKLLGLLREPMLQIARRDQNFFSCDSHPARRLLNVMADAAIGWDAGANSCNDPLYRKVEHVVLQLARYAGNNPALLESLLHDFSMFTRGERSRTELLEQRTRDAEQVRCRPAVQRNPVRSWPSPVLDEQAQLGLLLVSQLRVGAWIELQEDETTRLRCKLITILEPDGTHIFVNRIGAKMLEKSRNDLIVHLRNGSILLVDDRLLIDRALESVIDSLRQAGGE
ncbi:DUF1631 family protein [Pseudomonas sp. FSL R10-2964]|nr:DUF1631 family protein [Pseudomonas sp. FSL R10-2964]MQT83816.1 DUF1631 family protein [Pseudomonas sp. FSL R10-2964]